jgi:membrane protease YdiL (CAAX protease family)
MTHSALRSIALHLLPGLPVVVLYVLLAPLLNSLGYPSQMALAIAALFGIVPLQLGHLFYKGYQINGRISLKGVITPVVKMPIGKFALLLVTAIVLLVVISGITLLFESSIKVAVFNWLPDWYFYDGDLKAYSREVLIATALVRLGVDGIVLPITEELYFRGYLYPRLPETLKHQYLMAAVLFALYHFWQPWNYFSLFLISLVLVWPVAKFKNVYLSVAIHMVANLLGTVLFFGQVLK